MIMIIKETTKAEGTTDHPKAEDSIVIENMTTQIEEKIERDRTTQKGNMNYRTNEKGLTIGMGNMIESTKNEDHTTEVNNRITL